METYVLIPAELSLVSSLSVTRDSNPGKQTTRASSSSLIAAQRELILQRRVIEGDGAGARVYANQRLPRGKRFLPFEGTVRIDKLDIFPFLDEDDIRHCFGSYDEIQELSKWKYRQCNWVRFLRYSSVFSGDVNVLGTLVKGEPVYETIRPVLPDTELVAYFEDPEAILRNRGTPGSSGGETGCFEWSTGAEWVRNRHFVISQYRHTMGIILEATPLDLSQPLLNDKVKVPNVVAASEYQRPRVSTSPTFSSPFIRGDSTSPIVGATDDRLPMTIVNKFKKETTRRNYTEISTSLTQQKRGKERTLLPCEVCGKAFDRPSLLRRHMRTHTGEKPHVCDVCGKGFSTSSSLNTHRRIHSGEKPHQCHVCGKRFTASSNLYYHRMTHSKEKPHKCSLCSKSFPTPGDLKSHMYVHNGSWPFKCHICSRGFSKQTNLKNHLFLHTGDKPHVCSYCQKRFALACNLRAHLKTHEGEQLERCTKCFKSFPIASGILVHGYCHSCYHQNSSDGISLAGVLPANVKLEEKLRLHLHGHRDDDRTSRKESGALVTEHHRHRKISDSSTTNQKINGVGMGSAGTFFPRGTRLGLSAEESDSSPSPSRQLRVSKDDETEAEEDGDGEEDEEEEEEEEEDAVELEEETRRQFVLGVLDQVMLRYEQAGALIAKSLELNRSTEGAGGGGASLEHGVATSG